MPPKFQRWKGIMKAYPFEEKRLLKWEPPFIVQPKYDGIRCRAVPLERGYVLLSSEENVIFSVPHINEQINKVAQRLEFDGELYAHGMGFEQITSITSRTVNLHPDHKLINYHIFDYIGSGSQAERTKILNGVAITGDNIIKAPYWICETLDDIMRTYDILLNNNYEGIIVRHISAPYERKRSLYVMKFKPKKEDSYVITGYKEELTVDGNPKGRLGAITCLSGDGEVFSVGSGFSEEARIKLWETRDTLGGKVAKVQYQHLTTGKKVPRFPVFVEVIDEEDISLL